jgi:branched-chain amino acid transport system substrate-binding protein
MKKALSMVLATAMMVSVFALCGSTAFADSTPIKIGGIGPVTGPAAIYGKAVETAMQIAVEEVNALGGVQFEMNFQDDAHDAETSVNAYGNLMDWGMQVLIGTVTSTPCAAVAAEAADEHIFVLTPSASSPSVTEGKTNVFQMCFSDPNQGVASADYISENNLGSAIAVIYNNGDAYSTGIYEKFVSEADEKGLNIVYTGTFTDDSATDFSSQLTAARDAGADLLFLPIYYTPISVIMNQCAAMNWDVSYFGVDGMDGLLTLEGFDTSLAEGAYLLTPFSADATDDLTTSFVEKYKAACGDVPNQFAADAYDCVWAVYDVCTENNLDGSMSAQDLCDALIEGFTNGFTFSGLTGSDMTWNTSGEVSKAPKAVVIHDGAYVLNEQ